MQGIDPSDFWLLAPEILLAVAGLLLLLVGTIGRGMGNRESAVVTLVSLGLTVVVLVQVQSRLPVPMSLDDRPVILGGMFVLDGFAFFWKLLFARRHGAHGAALAALRRRGEVPAGEYYSLLLLAATGMMFMASGYSLLSIWISLEPMALSSYILAGYFKRELKSNEAALKYFILGAMSSGILLYGISLLYGATGTVQLDELASGPRHGHGGAATMLVPLGWILLAAGLFFKVAAVPFHVWAPDVYVGAPTPITAWLAVASKAASFAILVRIFYEGLRDDLGRLAVVVAAVSALTMIWGNVAALTQDNVKRMLAYCSIAHAGYVLMGVLAASEIGLWSVVFYMLAYTFITLGAFGTVILLERREYAGETAADYAGLARRSPFLAAMMLIFMLALTGIPPTGGFVGKFYLFAAAVQAGWTWLAVIGVVMSAVSLYYYFRIVLYMYLRDSTAATPVPLPSRVLVGTVAFCALVTLALGIYPGPFIDFAKTALLPLP